MKRKDIDRLLDSVDLREVELPEGFVERTWEELRPIVEAPQRRVTEEDRGIETGGRINTSEPSGHELIPIDDGVDGRRGGRRAGWRVPAMIAAAAAIIIGFVVATVDDGAEVQSVESSLLQPAEACRVLNAELENLPGGAMFYDWRDRSIDDLSSADLIALASVMETFLATTDPSGLDDQFRQIRIIRSGLVLAAAQREAGDDDAASASVGGALDNIHDDNSWHVEGPLEDCFER